MYNYRPPTLTKLLLIISIFISVNIAFAQKENNTVKIRKLYIASIKPQNVPISLADRVRNGIMLSIFEGYSDKYQVLDDEAIRVMYAQAAAIMSSGCDDESCVTQIADGINADEIVYGDVLRDGIKFVINIKCLERKGTTIGTKSIIKISFYESQLDFAASEAAKKIVNPNYKIVMSETPVLDEKIKLGGIEIKSINNLDISIIKFNSDDETVNKIIDYLKSLVSEGDSYFKKQEYSKARDKYCEIINKVKTKLSAEKQLLVKEYVEGINKRIDSSYVMQQKPNIDNIDVWLNEINNPEIKDFEDGLQKYTRIESEIINIPSPFNSSREELLSAINDRKDSLHIAISDGFEKKADFFYKDYQFSDAMDWYNKAIDRIYKVNNNVKKNKAVDRINKKISTTQDTGRSYLLNRVKSLVDQAEFYNFQDNNNNAKKSMGDARNLITRQQWIFATLQTLDIFNRFASVLGIEKIISDDEKSVVQNRRKNFLSSKASFVRIGYGGFGSITMSDSTLSKYYKDGEAIFTELDIVRLRNNNGNGFDFFARYIYRTFSMTDSTFNDFQSTPPALNSDDFRRYEISKSKILMHGIDHGLRYSMCFYLLYERWDIYVSVAYRYLYLKEKAESGLSYSFRTSGIICGLGIEVTLTDYIALFTEYQNGYTPIGESNRNVEGHQLYFGATFRMRGIVSFEE